MMDKKKELTSEELAAQTGENLPDREEMSLVNANLAARVNAAVAANAPFSPHPRGLKRFAICLDR
jgi:hypothetical protein